MWSSDGFEFEIGFQRRFLMGFESEMGFLCEIFMGFELLGWVLDLMSLIVVFSDRFHVGF